MIKRQCVTRIPSRLPVAVCVALLTSCAATPERPDSNQLLTLDEAARQVADSVASQLKTDPSALGRLRASVGRPTKADHPLIVVDPMVDGTSGQQTALSADLQQRILAQLVTGQSGLEVVSFTSESIARAQLVMTGTIALEQSSVKETGSSRSTARIQLALTSLKTGVVTAQASARVKTAEFDLTPNKFEQDSPAVLKDPVVRGYIQTAATAAGTEAYSSYFKHLTASTEIAEGTNAYNQTQYAKSLQHFQAALSDSSGQQLRALNGTYLADVKLGKVGNAEEAFARIVAFGVSNRDFGVKFLFNPNTTEFWSDAVISGPYDMWLREIARVILQSQACVNVVGHASHTGSESYNDKLSEQRAQRIRQRLVSEAPGLSGRLTAKGVGFRENIVGLGSDDARDAQDRRVSFEFRDCGS